MGLHIKQPKWLNVQSIVTLIAVLALAIQPMYGFVEGYVANAVAGATRYVATTASSDAANDCTAEATPCATIAHAISQANAGDTISVGAGTYASDLIIDKKINLRGKDLDAKINGQITFNGASSGSKLHSFTITTVGKSFTVGVVGVSDIEIDNNTFAGTSANGTSAKAIYVGDADSSNITIRNNMIRTVTSDKGAYGILINKKNFTGLVIKDNHIKTLTGDWVHAIGLEGNTPGAVVSNNHISGLVSTTANTDVRGVFFEDNSSSSTVFVSGDLNGKIMTNSTSSTVAFEGWASLSADLEVLSNDNIYRYIGQNAFATTQGAVDAVDVGGTVKLLGDQHVASSVLIKKPLTFDGNGFTVISSFGAGATSAYSGVIEIQNVTNGAVKFVANSNKVFRVSGEGNKAIDGPGQYNGLHGVNVYKSNVELSNVIVENNGKSGLNVGLGSTVTINGLTTKNNKWNGIDVDKMGAKLNVNGVNQFVEQHGIPAIYIDDINVGQVTLGVGVQLASVDHFKSDGHGGKLNDRAYFVTTEQPEAPTNLHRQDKNGKIYPCGVVTQAQAFSPYWTKSASLNVTHYEYSSFNKNGVPGVVERNLGNVNHMTNTSWVAPDGTGFKFAVRAVNDLGLKSAWVECGISYDSQPPVLTLNPVPSTVAGTYALTGTASDAGSGLRGNDSGTEVNKLRVTFWQLDSNGNHLSLNGEESSTKKTLKANVDGLGNWIFDVNTKDGWFVDGAKYEVVVRANDMVGTSYPSSNTSAISSYFTVDNTAPNAPLITPSPTAGAASGQFKITVAPAATDGGTIKSVTFKDANGNDITPANINGDVYTVDTTGMRKGAEINVVATAVDAVGNESAESTESYTVNNGAPSVSVDSLTHDAAGNFTLNGTSGYAAGAAVTVVTSNGTYTGITGANGDWHVSVGQLNAATAYSFTVTIVNTLGYNSNPATATYTTPAVNTAAGTVSPTGGVIIPIFATPGAVNPTTTTGGVESAPSVLGDSTTKPEVKGNSIVADAAKKVAALTTDTKGWSLFSLAWYYWLLIIAAIAGLWWFLAARRRAQEQEA